MSGRRSMRLRVALGLVGAVVAAGFAAGFTGDPFAPSEAVLVPPSSAHPLGTDELGRDLLTRILHGAATALLVSIPPAAVAAVAGTALGLLAGYHGGWLDESALKAAELTLVVPRFLIALVAAALFGGSVWLVATVLAATFWPSTMRLVRAEAISLRRRTFTEAAVSLGAGDGRILLRHLLPLVLPVVVVNASFQAGQGALIEAGLAFLGLGDRDVVSWGAMLADAQTYVGLAWWLPVFPGLVLSLLILALNLLGDGFGDVWNVRVRT